MRASLALVLMCVTGSAFAQGIVETPPDTPGYEAGETIEEDAAPAPAVSATPAAPATPPAEEAPPLPPNAIRLQGLNKVTARISTLEAPLGTVMNFGNLEIIARRCWQAPPEERPENAALLEIRELKTGEGPQIVFSGWMFSSSPALSALEHPVYDMTVLSCLHMDSFE